MSDNIDDCIEFIDKVADDRNNLKKQLAKAMEAYEVKDYETAIRITRYAANSNGHYYDDWTLMGLLYIFSFWWEKRTWNKRRKMYHW